MRVSDAKIRTLIYKKEMTQTALAQQIGVSRNTVNAVCSGKRCSEKTARAIAAALGVNVEELIEGKEG